MPQYYLPQLKNVLGKEILINLPEIEDNNLKYETLEIPLAEAIKQTVKINDIQALGDEVYGLFLSTTIDGFGKILSVAKVPGKVIVENVTSMSKRGHTNLGGPR